MLGVQINYLAVLIAAIASFAIGALYWYCPKLFGKTWMRLSGIKEMKGTPGRYITGFIATFITAFVLAHFIGWFSPYNVGEAIKFSIIAWIGFIAAIHLGSVLWDKKPIQLYLLNICYHLVSFIVMAAIISAWNPKPQPF